MQLMAKSTQLLADDDLAIRDRLSCAALVPMPQVLLQLMEHCQSEHTGMAELAGLIAKDAAMTAKILRVANSAAYSRRTQLVSLEQALLAIGIDMVKIMVISESVFKVSGGFSQAATLDLRGFWKHSLLAAFNARLIAEQMKYHHAEEAYLAGLLHDVGRLALVSVAPQEYAATFFAPDDDSLCAIEQRILQLTHAEAGAWLIGQWNLDSFLADSVLYHHEPAARLEEAHPLIRIVALADALSCDMPDAPAALAAGASCGLAAADLEKIAARAGEQLKEAADYLAIDLAETVPAPVFPAPAQPAARERLDEKVRNLVVASEAGKSLSKLANEVGLAEAVVRSACVLFDFSNAVLFLADGAEPALTGMPAGEGLQRLAGMSVPLDRGGRIAEAAQQGRPSFIVPEPAGADMLEAQLSRMLSAECLACLPLGAGGRCAGLIIGGISAGQIDELRRREDFMQAYAAQTSAALGSIDGASGDAGRLDAALAEEYRQASRRVAHEVNNPLSIIKNYLGVLDRKLTRNETISGEISILNEEIDRVSQLVNTLADFEPPAQESATDLHRTIASVVQLFQTAGSMPPALQITVHKPEQACEIDADANSLKQILMNLIKNAVEAMPAGGKIDIGSNGMVNRDGRMHVELWIADTGPGIPPQVMAKLFSPVQSTKGAGHRGLGLSIVHGLVKKLNGHISCRSNSKGTAFEILLPVMHT